MTRERSTPPADPEAPITGVASGSLGTAANLDDTQVISTVEPDAAGSEGATSEAAAAPVATSREPAPGAAGVETAGLGAAPFDASPLDTSPLDAARLDAAEVDTASLETPSLEPSLEAAPTAAYPVAPVVRSARRGTNTRLPALAGIVAVALLAFIAAAGIISTLDFGAAGIPGAVPQAPAAAPTPDGPTSKPKDKPGRGDGGGGGGRDHGCHGHGHGCHDGGGD